MGGIYKHLYQDWLQLFLLAVCLFDLIFFSYYLFAYELAAQNTISDSLFQHAEYLVILSVTLAIRSLGVCLYLMRYRNEASGWVIAGFAGLSLTLFGWGWLASHKDNVNHFIGVFLFCAGSSLYSISLLRLAGGREKHLAKLHLAMEICLFVSTVALVLAFVILWAIEESSGHHLQHVGEYGDKDDAQNAYIVEHTAYIVFLLFYATFFLFHTPDPMEPPGLREAYVEEHAMDPESVCMRPLMHG